MPRIDSVRALLSGRMRFCSLLFFLLIATIASAEVIQPKVVVVAMFEVGQDTGDAPGEYQFWVERLHLDRVVPLPAAYHDVRVSADRSVVAILTGVGNIRACSSIMALGLDPRFDLRKTYWLVAGIAGIDPADGSLGSAAWADYVVDGDLAHEIDAREIPAGWPTGYIPLDHATPYEKPAPRAEQRAGHVYELNHGLVQWAYSLTRDTPLSDHEKMKERRARFTGFPVAQRPPFVLKGDNLASSTFWHGKLLNAWANEWVRYYTDARANYVTTAMEDAGTLYALNALTRAGRADASRALVLRTASNYDMPWPGATAAESLKGENDGLYSGYLPSLEAAFLVGNKVVTALCSGWKQYEQTAPSSPLPAGPSQP